MKSNSFVLLSLTLHCRTFVLCKLNCREEIGRFDILEILVAHPVRSVTDLHFCYGSRMINVI